MNHHHQLKAPAENGKSASFVGHCRRHRVTHAQAVFLLSAEAQAINVCHSCTNIQNSETTPLTPISFLVLQCRCHSLVQSASTCHSLEETTEALHIRLSAAGATAPPTHPLRRTPATRPRPIIRVIHPRLRILDIHQRRSRATGVTHPRDRPAPTRRPARPGDTHPLQTTPKDRSSRSSRHRVEVKDGSPI